MASKQLNEFFKEKVAKSMPSDVDWEAKRDAWIAAVGKLYDTIQKEYLESVDIVKVDRSRMKTVQEAYIGDYTIAELTLAVGDELVVFSPKGVNVLGAAGRVDVRGDRGEATLVRQGGDQWVLVSDRAPILKFAPLSEETFLGMLRSIMR